MDVRFANETLHLIAGTDGHRRLRDNDRKAFEVGRYFLRSGVNITQDGMNVASASTNATSSDHRAQRVR